MAPRATPTRRSKGESAVFAIRANRANNSRKPRSLAPENPVAWWTVSSGNHPMLDSGVQGQSMSGEFARALAENFARATPILSALVAGTPSGDTLIVAVDSRGFPVAQTTAPTPKGLPFALVVGRHNRCGLAVPQDNRVSLRHLLLTLWPGQSGLLIRGYDLGGRAGVALPNGARVAGFSAHGRVALSFGRTFLYALPGGAEGSALLAGAPEQAYQRLTGLDLNGGGQMLAVAAEAGVAEIGGYRAMELGNRSSRGFLQLRSTKSGHEDDSVRELDVSAEQLSRGLLIGRYSDRCSLAGAGRNLSRVHALVTEEGPNALLVYDLASTNGVRPAGVREGPSHAVVRMTPDDPCMLGHFELSWVPPRTITVH